MSGGVSQVDTFDPKPALTKYAGQPLDGKVAGDVIVRQGYPGPLMPSPFAFKKYGQSGIEVSELFPHISRHVDEIAFLRSVYGQSNDHVQAHLRDADRPDHAWVSRASARGSPTGSGSENASLPAYVVMTRRARRPARRRQRLERPASCRRPTRARCSARPAIRSSI